MIALLIAAALWAREDKGPFFGRNGDAFANTNVLRQEVSLRYGNAGMGGKKGVSITTPVAPSVMNDSLVVPRPYPDAAGETAADVDQKIVKTGSLDMLVENVSEAVEEMGSLAVQRGGFVQSSNVSEGGNGVYYGEVVVRVPVEAFESAMADLRSLATLVRSESANGQDVTEHYTDLEARLRNAEAQEKTYLDILKQAKNVEDILSVQERLGSIREQIETLKGRIRYLANTTSFSTISLTVSEEPVVRAPTKEFRPVTIVKAAFQTLVVVGQQAVAGMIWLVIVWGGILLPISFVTWLIYRVWKRRARR